MFRVCCFIIAAGLLAETVYGRSIWQKRVGNGLQIINGENTTIEEHPYQVALETIQEDSYMFAGGIIISEYWVLSHNTTTPIFRVWPNEGTPIQVRAGTSYPKEGGVVIPVSQIVNNVQFVPLASLNWTIATLLKLETPLVFSSTIQPITLANENELLPTAGTLGTVTGFGAWDSAFDLPPVLQKYELPILNDTECRNNCEWDVDYVFCGREILKDRVKDGPSDIYDEGGAFVVNNTAYGMFGAGGFACYGDNHQDQIDLALILIRISEIRPWIRNITNV